jgi:hypothetical protein
MPDRSRLIDAVIQFATGEGTRYIVGVKQQRYPLRMFGVQSKIPGFCVRVPGQSKWKRTAFLLFGYN